MGWEVQQCWRRLADICYKNYRSYGMKSVKRNLNAKRFCWNLNRSAWRFIEEKLTQQTFHELDYISNLQNLKLSLLISFCHLEKDHSFILLAALVDLLISKTKEWEDERKKVFLYDEVPLLAMLEEYNMLRKEREEEKQRQREQKKSQIKVVTVHDCPFGSRPSTSSRRLSDKSINGGFGNASPRNRRSSLGLQPMGASSINSPDHGIPLTKGGKKANGQKAYNQKDFAYHLREDTMSVVSSFSVPFSH